MDIVKIQNSRYDEYEALLLERDQLEREAGAIWTAYIKEFGQLMTDVFEEKVECIRRKKMIAYYQKAAELGDPDSWMSIAYCYAEGKGVERSFSRALELYEKAADAGSALACDYLGYLYMTGELVEADPEKGLSWYRAAAELGNSRSMFALGVAYQYGQGVAADPAEAARWYEKAALAGRADAAAAYAAIQKTGEGFSGFFDLAGFPVFYFFFGVGSGG